MTTTRRDDDADDGLEEFSWGGEIFYEHMVTVAG